MHKTTDITVAHLRLAEMVPPNDVALWGLIVDRNRALITALSGDDKTFKDFMMHRLTGVHQSMRAPLQSVG
jgi:hypothetical protein